MTLTLGSLFDGIGGWQLAAQHAGVEPIWFVGVVNDDSRCYWLRRIL